MRAVYTHLQSLGATTVPSSRIGTYLNAFEQFIAAGKGERPFDLLLAYTMLTAFVEFTELKAIFKAATLSDNPLTWQARIRDLASGRVFDHRAAETGTRDFQFECFAGAVAQLAGYSVTFTEPDLLISDGRMSFSVAAKRPRSISKLRRHFRKGLAQIRTSGVPGLIAIDASYLIFRDQCINTNALEGATATIHLAVDSFVDSQQGLFMAPDLPRSLLGTIVCLHKPMLNFGVPGSQLGTALRWTVVPPTPSTDPRWLVEFARRCQLGYFGPTPNIPNGKALGGAT